MGDFMVKLSAKMKDGTPVTITFEDLGDTIPAFDADDNRYNAYSSKFVCDKFGEIYVQVDKEFIDKFGADERMARDYDHLDAIGVDTTTIEIT